MEVQHFTKKLEFSYVNNLSIKYRKNNVLYDIYTVITWSHRLCYKSVVSMIIVSIVGWISQDIVFPDCSVFQTLLELVLEFLSLLTWLQFVFFVKSSLPSFPLGRPDIRWRRELASPSLLDRPRFWCGLRNTFGSLTAICSLLLFSFKGKLFGTFSWWLNSSMKLLWQFPVQAGIIVSCGDGRKFTGLLANGKSPVMGLFFETLSRESSSLDGEPYKKWGITLGEKGVGGTELTGVLGKEASILTIDCRLWLILLTSLPIPSNFTSKCLRPDFVPSTSVCRFCNDFDSFSIPCLLSEMKEYVLS